MSTAARRYAANAVWMLAAEVAAKLANFILLIIIARWLGAAELGYFYFAISFVPLFLILSNWGVRTTVIRELAQDEARLSELFTSGLVLRVLLGFVALLVSFALAPLFVETAEAYFALVLVGIALFIDEVSIFIGAVFLAFERMQFQAWVSVTNRVATTALALAAVARGGGLLTVCVTYVLGSLVSLFLAVVVLRRFFPPIDVRAIRRDVVRRIWAIGGSIGIADFLNMALFRVDAVMLQAIRGPVEVAIYGVAYRFFESLLFVTWGLANVAYPGIARATRAEATRIFELTALCLLAFYLPVAAGTPFAAEWLVVSLFSERYAEAASVAAWLAAASLFYGVAHLGRMAAVALARQREVAWIAAAVLAVNVALNGVLIPAHGFSGAAWSTLVTAILESILLLGLFSRINARPSIRRTTSVPLIATACMVAVLVALGARGSTAFVVALLVYPAALSIAALVVAPDELRRAGRLLRRRNVAAAGVERS